MLRPYIGKVKPNKCVIIETPKIIIYGLRTYPREAYKDQ